MVPFISRHRFVCDRTNNVFNTSHCGRKHLVLLPVERYSARRTKILKHAFPTGYIPCITSLTEVNTLLDDESPCALVRQSPPLSAFTPTSVFGTTISVFTPSPKHLKSNMTGNRSSSLSFSDSSEQVSAVTHCNNYGETGVQVYSPRYH